MTEMSLTAILAAQGRFRDRCAAATARERAAAERAAGHPQIAALWDAEADQAEQSGLLWDEMLEGNPHARKAD